MVPTNYSSIMEKLFGDMKSRWFSTIKRYKKADYEKYNWLVSKITYFSYHCMQQVVLICRTHLVSLTFLNFAIYVQIHLALFSLILHFIPDDPSSSSASILIQGKRLHPKVARYWVPAIAHPLQWAQYGAKTAMHSQASVYHIQCYAY